MCPPSNNRVMSSLQVSPTAVTEFGSHFAGPDDVGEEERLEATRLVAPHHRRSLHLVGPRIQTRVERHAATRPLLEPHSSSRLGDWLPLSGSFEDRVARVPKPLPARLLRGEHALHLRGQGERDRSVEPQGVISKPGPNARRSSVPCCPGRDRSWMTVQNWSRLGSPESPDAEILWANAARFAHRTSCPAPVLA